MNLHPDFELTSVSGTVVSPSHLGPLAHLVGVWHGHGFNQIWRPLNGPQDRFLELNETSETLEFDRIPGNIPNRGLLQPDINLHGLRYLQQIVDANVLGGNGKPAGIHVEPGVWLRVPDTTNPIDAPTVARLANIPHGTAFVAQGSASTVPGPPVLTIASITPFVIGNPAQLVPFPESTLATPSQFRTPAADIPNVTQAEVDDPNTLLAAGIAGKTITETTILTISTVPLNPPATGGGADNIAFLVGATGGPNAQAAQVDATFWIETLEDDSMQLQYSQRVLLNFNGLSWPHVSVATLAKA